MNNNYFKPSGKSHTPMKITSPAQMLCVRKLRRITGTSEPCAIIKIRIDDSELFITTAHPDGTWLVTGPFGLSVGQHIIYALSSQKSGAGAFVVFDINPSCPADDLPLLKISYPANGEEINTPMPIIRGTAAPGREVILCVKNLMCTKTLTGGDGGFSAVFQKALADGDYTLRAAQIDEDGGRRSSAQSRFTVKAPPLEPFLPSPVVDSPKNGSELRDGGTVFKGSSIPGNTVSVCIRRHGCQTRVVENNGSYNISFPEALPEGVYTAAVLQRDMSGEVSPAALIRFRVSPQANPAPPADIP